MITYGNDEITDISFVDTTLSVHITDIPYHLTSTPGANIHLEDMGTADGILKPFNESWVTGDCLRRIKDALLHSSSMISYAVNILKGLSTCGVYSISIPTGDVVYPLEIRSNKILSEFKNICDCTIDFPIESLYYYATNTIDLRKYKDKGSIIAAKLLFNPFLKRFQCSYFEAYDIGILPPDPNIQSLSDSIVTIEPTVAMTGGRKKKVTGGEAISKMYFKGDKRLQTHIEFNTDFLNWLQDLNTSVSFGDNSMYDLGMKTGYIEYLDPEMAITNAVIAPSVKEFLAQPHLYTHIAMPNQAHGIIVSCIPGFSLNVGVRASYSTNHVKSAIGPSLRYPQLKYMGENNILCSPHVPLIRPCTYDYLRMGETPYGQNIVVAFIQDKFNQEDSCIMNAASVESGLLQIDSLTNNLDELELNDDKYEIPSEKMHLSGNATGYSKLDPVSSLPARVGELFYERDPLISKTRKLTNGTTDISILNKKPDGKYPPTAFPRPLRCVIKNEMQSETKTYKMVETGQFRLPIPGDKTNSEHAQKCTIGAILDPKDIPYTTCGLKPDLIFSAPSVFKRKTYGQVYISILSKIAALLGCPLDTTSYHTIRTPDDVRETLRKLGLDEQGKEVMFDPITGKAFKSRVFFSNHYWERQAHLVENKINIRNGGLKQPTTGQPVGGRKRTGGQSIDRMAADAFIASGASNIIRSTRLEQGSKIKIGFCQRCHCPQCYLHAETMEWICPSCGKHPNIIVREIPPAANLIMHVFNAAHVAIDYYDNAETFNDEDVQKLLHDE